MWGLWFREHQTRIIQLTLCGEALVKGQNPVPLLTKQVITFQYPAPYFLEGRASINPEFHIHPYRFILELLLNEKIKSLTEEELARIVIFAKNATELNNKAEEIQNFRKETTLSKVFSLYYKYSDEMYRLGRKIKKIVGADNRIEGDIIDAITRDIGCSKDTVQTIIMNESRFEREFGTEEERESIANMMVNYLEYTQLIERQRETESCFYIKDKEAVLEVFQRHPMRFIPIHHRANFLETEELFQRQYGLDLFHQKDTRKLTKTPVVSRKELAKRKIIGVYETIQAGKPTPELSSALFKEISQRAGCPVKQVESVISSEIPPPGLEAFERKFVELSTSSIQYTQECLECRLQFKKEYLTSMKEEFPEGISVDDFAPFHEELMFTRFFPNCWQCEIHHCANCLTYDSVLYSRGDYLIWLEEKASWYCNNCIGKYKAFYNKFRYCCKCGKTDNLIWHYRFKRWYCVNCVPKGYSIYR
jgi:hypothetical protein